MGIIHFYMYVAETVNRRNLRLYTSIIRFVTDFSPK